MNINRHCAIEKGVCKLIYERSCVYIKQGWTNFFLGARFFGRVILLARLIGHAKKMDAQNQIARPIKTQLETLLFALYYLSST